MGALAEGGRVTQSATNSPNQLQNKGVASAQRIFGIMPMGWPGTLPYFDSHEAIRPQPKKAKA